QIGDLACVMIVAAVSDRIAVAVDKLVGRRFFVVPISLVAASNSSEALCSVLGKHFVERPPRRRIAQMLCVHALGDGSLLAIPVGVMDAIMPVFFSNFFLVPVINVVIGALADYDAAALARRAINETDLIYLQPGEDLDFGFSWFGHATSLLGFSPNRLAISR